jgi:polyhydroxybutyrate depolymerase
MRTLLVLVALVVVPAIAHAEPITFTVDGVARRALIYVPPVAAPPSGFPLVLAFHGRGDVVDNFELVNLHGAWPEAIVVYLQALDREGYPGWQVERGQDGDRDLKLVDTALSTLKAKYRIDADRVYAVGFSNGAGFTFMLWADRPNLFSAYAIVAGRWRAEVQPKERRPAILVSGIQDPGYADHRAGMVNAIVLNGVRTTTSRCGNGCQMYGGGSPTPVVTVTHRGGHEFPAAVTEHVVTFLKNVPRKPESSTSTDRAAPLPPLAPRP